MLLIKSGFACIIGRPNVGKSTLLNQFMGRKVAIVSDKPQTTRNRILGILTTEDAQAVFIDTPGIHKPRHKLGAYMTRLAQETLEEVDLVIYVVDASVPPGTGEEYILEQLQEVSTPVLLVLNKIDLIKKQELLPLIDWFSKRYDFQNIVPVSALTAENLDKLRELIAANLKESPFFYPAEMVTDQPEKFVAAEIIREKVLHLTREEVPHAVAVVIEEMKERENGLFYINAVVYVERDSQKGIIIGRGGRMLKEIGQLARQELQAILGNKVYLDLWVKVKKDWRDDEAVLRSFGYE
ncbi:MAG: GTPase Era [Syntrophaceticus schinkii]|nr:GTPase Era [Syntrophaceticus schinkii]MDD4261275.1 GTPase Era [Syntrophaceticus schinkii]MDD4674501.1 GTPase Era [Syntrophaceticus schinkii]